MWVRVSSAQRPPDSVELGPGAHLLGRSPDCQLMVEDPLVSKRHAQLNIAESGAWLADLGSTNGTFVDGQRLQAPVWLAAPGEFRVGETTVSLMEEESIGVSGPPPPLPATAPTPTPPTSIPAAPPASTHVARAGPVAGGDVLIRGGRDAAGRDLIIHEGLKLRSKMRSSAKNCLRLGCVLFLAGFGLFGYFIIAWNNELFGAVTKAAAGPPSGLPSPLPWLPLGAALMFTGLVFVVTGLLIPRDRIVTRRDE